MDEDFLQIIECIGLFGVMKEEVRGRLLDDLVKPITHGSKRRGALPLARPVRVQIAVLHEGFLQSSASHHVTTVTSLSLETRSIVGTEDVDVIVAIFAMTSR